VTTAEPQRALCWGPDYVEASVTAYLHSWTVKGEHTPRVFGIVTRAWPRTDGRMAMKAMKVVGDSILIVLMQGRLVDLGRILLS
jgi:hypothetical protein